MHFASYTIWSPHLFLAITFPYIPLSTQKKKILISPDNLFSVSPRHDLVLPQFSSIYFSSKTFRYIFCSSMYPRFSATSHILATSFIGLIGKILYFIKLQCSYWINQLTGFKEVSNGICKICTWKCYCPFIIYKYILWLGTILSDMSSFYVIWKITLTNH